MRHRVHYKGFNRRRGHRELMFKNLVTSLVDSERIRTTLAKAKELRRHVEKAITKGKDGTLHARRVLLSKFPNPSTVEKIVTDLSKRFDKRDGGYTRIVRLGKRPGDLAEMAYIEFVDYTAKDKSEKKETKGKGKEGKTAKADAKAAKAQARKVARRAGRHRKTLRKLQNQARQVSRELNA
jgi:large subunit ribosomal protein L17